MLLLELFEHSILMLFLCSYAHVTFYLNSVRQRAKSTVRSTVLFLMLDLIEGELALEELCGLTIVY
jgi:hypothetical protein